MQNVSLVDASFKDRQATYLLSSVVNFSERRYLTFCKLSLGAITADPLSIIASVLGIASTAVQSSKALFELVSDIREGRKEIRAVSKYVYEFYNLVSSLFALLDEAYVKRSVSDDEPMLDRIHSLTAPLKNCRAVLALLVIKIQRQMK